jgi:hypothetical protein
MFLDKIFRNEIDEVDFIISMGEACRVAHHLRQNDLRYVANPLDWMMDYTLDSALHWFKNDFDDFFSEIIEDPNKVGGSGYRWIVDKNTNAVSIHHFPVNVSLKENHEKFRKIMKKRTYRMNKIIRKSNRILFISNRNQPKTDFYRFLEEFKELYDKQYIFMNIKNQNIPFNKYTKILSKDLKFLEYTFNDSHKDGTNSDNPDFWKGNIEKWDDALKNIKLSSKFGYNSKNIDGKIIL